jgi:excisionase family DNA binding protein
LTRLLTTKEVAEYLQVGDTTVRQLRAKGKLRAVKMGDGPAAPVRYTLGELERFVHEHLEEQGCDESTGSNQESGSGPTPIGRIGG